MKEMADGIVACPLSRFETSSCVSVLFVGPCFNFIS